MNKNLTSSPRSFIFHTSMEANTTTEEKHAPAQHAVTTEVNETKPAKDPGQVPAGKKISRTQ